MYHKHLPWRSSIRTIVSGDIQQCGDQGDNMYSDTDRKQETQDWTAALRPTVILNTGSDGR